ncbi:MAG TPA: hypothetical protein PK198_07810, partial [Saprospiraceae bacterium]|nr:hypothetical protein [Saprospiraceae bacterium]
MKNYNIKTIQFDEEIGIGAACQADNNLLHFVLSCVAKMAAGEVGDVSEADAFRWSGIPIPDYHETEHVTSSWKLPAPFFTFYNERVDFVFIFLYRNT